MEVSPRRGSTVHPFFFYRILLSKLAINCEEVQWGSSKITVYQGTKKVIFTACQSGKLKLPFTCPNVISTSPQIFWWAELTSHFFCKLNSSKYFTCPLGKLRTEFTSPIAKSTGPGLSDTTFFVHCTCILGAWSPRGVSTYLFTEMPELLIQNSTFQMQSLFGSSYNLGQKVLRILYFLTHRTPINRIGTAMAPPLAPPWSKLSSQDQKWSSWNSTFFFGGGGEREYL